MEPDQCMLCLKGIARWLCISPIVHTYITITDDVPELVKQEDAVLLCNDCRRSRVQANRKAYRPRKDQWMRWS